MYGLPGGFLGTRADCLFDTIAISLVGIAGTLAWSMSLARARQYKRHRSVMMRLLIGLTIVLIMFETDLRVSGGPKVLFRQSRFAHSHFLQYSLYFHLFVAVTTFAAWVGLLLVSLRRFPQPLPGTFSGVHRVWGKSVFYGFLLVAVTALEVYVLGFVM
jgi:hypothetical protein